MKRIGWWPKNWRKLAKNIYLYPDDHRSLLELMEQGVYSRATVWNMLFGGIRTRRYNKPVKENVLKAYQDSKNTFQHMTNKELLERDEEWNLQYGKNRKVPSTTDEEEKYGILGDLRTQKHHDDDEEDEENY